MDAAPEHERDRGSGDELSRLAHELKNPLSVIAGYAELLLVRDDERTRREAPARIREAAELMSRRIDALLIDGHGPEAAE